MVKNLLYFVCSISILFSCNKEKELIVPEPAASPPLDNSITFAFRQIDNPGIFTQDVVCQVANHEISGSDPSLLKSDSLVASFTVPAGTVVTVNNVPQVSGVSKNDFSKPVVYAFKTPNGTVQEYSVKLITFTGLPILYINTADSLPPNSKDEYQSANLRIDGNGKYNQGLYRGGIQIRGRGNSTWLMPKKPYKIKLNQKAALLDMPADREWILLANYADKTLMRNYVSFELGRRLGLKYTPRTRFVELVLNNEYVGNYLLTEQIKVSKDRVDIKEMGTGDTSNDLITGGYLLEVDVRQDADFYFKTKKDISFCIKSPENIVPLQLSYIKNYVQKAEDALYADSFTDPSEGYAKYLDVDSFINWYILNEITKNTDAVFHTSVYLYKDRGGKLAIGPAWDFDIALGNIDYNDNKNPEGFYIQASYWIERLFQDPVFKAKVVNRFNEVKATKLNTLPQYINQTALYLEKSQAENFKYWDILDSYVWPNAVVLGDYHKEVAYLNEWLIKRLAWMDQEFNQLL